MRSLSISEKGPSSPAPRFYVAGVDLETLLTEHQLVQASVRNKEDVDGPSDDSSIMRTGLLPRWQRTSDGHRFDSSALVAEDSLDQGIRLFSWQGTNTDQMVLTERTAPTRPMAHRVRLNNELRSLLDYLPIFVDGFKELYSCLLMNRRKLVSDEQLLKSFDDLELRILVRNTHTYTRLLLHLLHPEFLRDGIDRSIELDWLAKPLSGPRKPEKARATIYEIERTAMEALDIPHFRSSSGKYIVKSSTDPDILVLFGKRNSSVLRRRLAGLSETDRSRQVEKVKSAVLSHYRDSD